MRKGDFRPDGGVVKAHANSAQDGLPGLLDDGRELVRWELTKRLREDGGVGRLRNAEGEGVDIDGQVDIEGSVSAKNDANVGDGEVVCEGGI
ncbi:MAG: hypothetical protein BroJett003_07650 [Planctomycetota bacterium]|nr:MAG: hypothetical protein BroJett003_07650 [Planctomycetota bacterium]